jgi:IS1 family transposase
VTYEDLEKHKSETAKETAALLEQREISRSAEKEADAVYHETFKSYQDLAKEREIVWRNSYTKSYDGFAKQALQDEIVASKNQNRAFDWDNVTGAIDADMKDLLGLDETQEEGEVKGAIKKPEIKSKGSQALTGLSEDMSEEFTKPSGIEKLEKALKDGTLSYDEKFRLYEELMDYKHSTSKQKRGLNVSSR